MTSVGIVYNNHCVKCGAVDKEMTRVGSVVMCHGCFDEVFKTDDPIGKERETYLFWVNKTQEPTSESNTNGDRNASR